MKRIVLLIFCLFLFSTVAGAQEKTPSKPKVGRYIQRGSKETAVRLCKGVGHFLNIQLVSVDVLDDKKMRLNFFISNIKDSPCTVKPDKIKNNPIYIIDENITKYKPLGRLKADWNPYKKDRYILASTERVKGNIIFPLLVEGARKFDFYFGYKAQPIKNVELIE